MIEKPRYSEWKYLLKIHNQLDNERHTLKNLNSLMDVIPDLMRRGMELEDRNDFLQSCIDKFKHLLMKIAPKVPLCEYCCRRGKNCKSENYDCFVFDYENYEETSYGT